MSLSDKHVIFCLGGPGAGKGTQCKMISNKYPVSHLSAGDLLRAEMARPESENGELIAELIKEGKIVPAAVTVKLLLNAIGSDDNKVFLIDGFPRNVENKDAWFAQAIAEGIDTAMCMVVDVSERTMAKRILGRSLDSGRSDDNEISMKKRFDTFNRETSVVIDFFEKEKKLLKVSGEGTVDEIFQVVDGFMSKFLEDHQISF